MKGNSDILKEFIERGNKAADDVAQLAVRNSSTLKSVFVGVTSTNKRVKNAAGKTLQIIGEIAPKKLYSKFHFILELVDGRDTILKWIGIDIVGNMTSIDRENRINKRMLEKLYSFLYDESVVTASHSIDTLGKIARSKPRYRKEITTELLKVEKIERNEECRNIHIGQTILAFSEYVEFVKDKGPILAFAERGLKNSRSPTRKKVQKFLAEFQTSS